MVTRLFLTSAVTAVMSTALFTRRSRSGWLEELDGIREGALLAPDGEVAAAMDGTEPMAEVSERPATMAEWADPTGQGTGFSTPPVPRRTPGGPETGRTGLPAGLPSILSALPPPPGRTPPPAEVAEVPAVPAAAVPVERVASAGEVPTARLAPDREPVAAPAPVRSPENVAAQPSPPAPPVEAAPTALPPAPSLAAGDGAHDEPAIPSPVVAPSVAPAPHRIHPEQMWHPDVVVAPAAEPEPTAEERLASAELYDDEPQTPKFRFARLRAVGPPTEPAVESSPVTDEPEPRPNAPLIPANESPGGLIAGPVVRRSRRRDQESRPLAPGTRSGDHRPGPPPEPMPFPRAEPRPPVPAARVVPVDEPVEAAIPVAEPVADPVPEPAPVEPAAVVPDPAPTAAPDPVPTPAAAEPVAPRRLEVAADHRVELVGGHLRLAPGPVPRVIDDGVSTHLELGEGWCWVTLGPEARPVTVELAMGSLTVPGGCTALAVVEPDGSTFVSVLDGAAGLMSGDGPSVLPVGTVVLAVEGGPWQFDRAETEELDADPVVARNRELDAER